MRPLASNTWEHASKVHVTARSKSVELWKALQVKVQALLKGAKPLTQKYLVKLQVRAAAVAALQGSFLMIMQPTAAAATLSTSRS